MSDDAYFKKRLMREVSRHIDRRRDLLATAAALWEPTKHGATGDPNERAILRAERLIEAVDEHLEPPGHVWKTMNYDVSQDCLVVRCGVCRKSQEFRGDHAVMNMVSEYTRRGQSEQLVKLMPEIIKHHQKEKGTYEYCPGKKEP